MILLFFILSITYGQSIYLDSIPWKINISSDIQKKFGVNPNRIVAYEDPTFLSSQQTAIEEGKESIIKLMFPLWNVTDMDIHAKQWWPLRDKPLARVFQIFGIKFTGKLKEFWNFWKAHLLSASSAKIQALKEAVVLHDGLKDIARKCSNGKLQLHKEMISNIVFLGPEAVTSCRSFLTRWSKRHALVDLDHETKSAVNTLHGMIFGNWAQEATLKDMISDSKKVANSHVLELMISSENRLLVSYNRANQIMDSIIKDVKKIMGICDDNYVIKK